MTTQELLDKANGIWAELSGSIKQSNWEKRNSLETCQRLLMEIDGSIRSLKELISEHTFESRAQEIHFFKEIKPKFISEYIFFSKVIELESRLPHASKKSIETILLGEFQKIGEFSEKHRELIAYQRKGASYLDAEYFLRYKYDLYMEQSLSLHSLNENFSTSKDGLFSEILANDKFEEYLNRRFQNLEKHLQQSSEITISSLNWTESKAALVELIYALHQSRSINSGTIELIKIIRTFETMFSVDLGNFHKILSELRERKIDRAKFLSVLSENLERSFTEKDET